MQIGEGTSVAITKLGEEEPDCKNQEKKDEYGWKAKVNEWGSHGDPCKSSKLYDNMWPGWKTSNKQYIETDLGVIPRKKKNKIWKSTKASNLTPTNFPLQAHHLIPKNYLPEHEICVWLCQKYGQEQHDSYELSEDTFYDTDHKNNGYAMPDAYRLPGWITNKQAKVKGITPEEREQNNFGIAFTVMDKTGIQLHQGNHDHTWTIPKENSEEDFEEDNLDRYGLEEHGYLTWLNGLLKFVRIKVMAHVVTCTKCKEKTKGKKFIVPPLEDTVRMMNHVSYIAKVFLDMGIVFISDYSIEHARENGVLIESKHTVDDLRKELSRK